MMAAVTPSIASSGLTWAQWLAKGTVGHLEALITANLAGNAAPTAAPTVSVSGSGGLLAAGTYYLRITESNGLGETTPSPESSQFTLTAGQEPVVTFPTLQSGNTARNVYVTPAGGASLSEVLYATGITAGTYSLTIAAPTGFYAMSPPTVNTTGLDWVDTSGVTNNRRLSLIRALKQGRFQDAWAAWHQCCTTFAQGEPISFGGVVSKLRDVQWVWVLLAQLATETQAFVDANPGHPAVITLGNGGAQTRRTWP
jgi:hypothetical protein